MNSLLNGADIFFLLNNNILIYYFYSFLIHKRLSQNIIIFLLKNIDINQKLGKILLFNRHQ